MTNRIDGILPISDLHLEFFKPNKVTSFARLVRNMSNARHLALLGDVGWGWQEHYDTFLDSVTKTFDTVLVLAGNHDYYSQDQPENTFDSIQQQMRDTCKKHGAFFLDNDKFDFPTVTVLGTTLWTDIPHHHRAFVHTGMTDYRAIYSDSEHLIHPRWVCEKHELAAEWLETEIREAGQQSRDVIVMTHHAPIPPSKFIEMHEEYRDGTYDTRYVPAYTTDMSHLFLPHVKAWAFGHTHHHTDIMIGPTHVVSNAVGYKDEKPTVKWSKAILLDNPSVW